MDTAILTAALELFAEHGIEGMSIEQVAKRAGVAKVTIYRRFSSKEQLVVQAFESARHAVPETSPEQVAEIGLAQYVEQTLDAQAEMLTRPGFRALIARLLGSSVSHPELMATYWNHFVLQRRQGLSMLLQQAKASGAIANDVDNDVLTDMVVGGIVYRLLQPNPPDAKELRAYLRAVYRQAGILP